MWSFAKIRGLCTPCAGNRVAAPFLAHGQPAWCAQGFAKPWCAQGYSQRCGAHKGIACAHVVPGTHAKGTVALRTMVRTRLDKFGAHKGRRNGAHKGAHKALGVNYMFANYHVYMYICRCNIITVDIAIHITACMCIHVYICIGIRVCTHVHAYITNVCICIRYVCVERERERG